MIIITHLSFLQKSKNLEFKIEIKGNIETCSLNNIPGYQMI